MAPAGNKPTMGIDGIADDKQIQEKCRGFWGSGSAAMSLWAQVQRVACTVKEKKRAMQPGGMWRKVDVCVLFYFLFLRHCFRLPTNINHLKNCLLLCSTNPGNEVCDKLASIGLMFSMILYLTQEFHLEQVNAANILSISNGTGYISPLIGGYLADSYLGRFWTLILSSLINLVGMSFLVITAAVSSLRPTPCPAGSDQAPSQCAQPTAGQLAFLYSAFTLLAIASGGIKPCAYPFGADQFNQDTFEGKKAFQSYSNWYFFGIYLSVLLSGTIVVYVQQSVSWAMGFGIPTIAMAMSIAIYILGAPLYKYEIPAGSPLKELAKVCTAAFFKRKLKVPEDSSTLFDPVPGEGKLGRERILHTDQFGFLDKAAIVAEGDISEDGMVLRQWRICTVHQVEQLKLIVRTLPIMIASMLHAVAVSQQTSYSVLQANTMDRHMFGSFHVPAASMGVFAMLTIMICLPLYDKVVLPFARRVTKTERGITFLQRIGIGYFMGIAAMVLSGIVEGQRRRIAREHGLGDKPGAVVPMSVFWLVPQLCMMGVGEAFNGVGTAEFFYDQVPEGMRSTAGSLNSCISGVGVYMSAMILTAVQKLSRRGDHSVSWLDDNLNKGHLDRYYYIVAGLIGVNLAYFLVCSSWYSYKNVAIAPVSSSSDNTTRAAEASQEELHIQIMEKEGEPFQGLHHRQVQQDENTHQTAETTDQSDACKSSSGAA